MRGGTDRLLEGEKKMVIGKMNEVTLGEANGIKAVLELVECGDLVSNERDLVVHVAVLENTVG